MSSDHPYLILESAGGERFPLKDPTTLGRVQSNDLLTGAIKWWYNCAPQGRAVHSSPLVANGIVYYGCLNGWVYALYSSQRGDRRGIEPRRLPVWKFDTGAAIYSSSAISDGQLYIGNDLGTLYAFGLP